MKKRSGNQEGREKGKKGSYLKRKWTLAKEDERTKEMISMKPQISKGETEEVETKTGKEQEQVQEEKKDKNNIITLKTLES